MIEGEGPMYVVDIDRLGNGDMGLVGPFPTSEDAQGYIDRIYGTRYPTHPAVKIRQVSFLGGEHFSYEEIKTRVYITRAAVERLKAKHGGSK